MNSDTSRPTRGNLHDVVGTSISRRTALSCAAGAVVALSGCAQALGRSYHCTGACDAVKDWSVDPGGGFGEDTTTVTVLFDGTFTGRIIVTFGDVYTEDGGFESVDMAKQADLEAANVHTMTFEGYDGTAKHVELHAIHGETP